MQTIPAKTILSAYGNSWFGANYNMNLYKGCCHGCIYCDSRSACYQVKDFDTVRAKENALLILEKDLRSKKRKGIIMAGAMSDSYNPFEAEERLTAGALALIDQHRFGVVLGTKSDLVLRDTEAFLKIREHSPAFVNFTVTTADDELCKKIEPNVCPTSRRIAAIKELKRAGVEGGIQLMPILPFINDTSENIAAIVELASDAGAKYIYPAMGVTLRQNQRDYFFDRLDEKFPGVKEQYVRKFGDDYACGSPRSGELWKIFKEKCEKNGILYRMKDIARYIRTGYDREQLSLF